MDQPVFIFAAAWRTGSTLLQRVVNASGDVFIWGEPRFLAQAQTLHKRLIEIAGQPTSSIGDLSRIESGAWIPTVFPGEKNVRAASASMLDTMFGTDVRAAKIPRWGFKEVRPNAVPAAQFLYELFPGCRFVFLVRHPLHTYHSLRNVDFFRKFKHPYLPANAWAKNAAGFLEVTRASSLPALLVRYEDLVGTPGQRNLVLENLCRHLSIRRSRKMDEELDLRTGESGAKSALSPDDINAVRQRTEVIARELGYEF